MVFFIVHGVIVVMELAVRRCGGGQGSTRALALVHMSRVQSWLTHATCAHRLLARAPTRRAAQPAQAQNRGALTSAAARAALALLLYVTARLWFLPALASPTMLRRAARSVDSMAALAGL